MTNEFQLRVIYEHEGGILAVQTQDQRFESCFKALKVVNAFSTCGMDIGLARKLFLEYLSLPIVNKEDQFTDKSQKQRTEHVITRKLMIDDKSIELLQVDFYPPFVEFGGTTITRVFTNTAEIIYGLEGKGVLEIVPVNTKGDKIFPDNDHLQDITIEHGTLVVLPPNVQGNRWKSLEPNSGTTPSLQTLFVAYPLPYKMAVTRKFDTKL